MTLYKENVYWTDLGRQVIERANKHSGRDRVILQDKATKVVDLFVYNKSRQNGSNICAQNNGGCTELCLYMGNAHARCACPSHHLFKDGKCIEPENFLLFGQKNKISRLLSDETHQNEVPDLVLPVRGARDIRSLGYDPLNRLIYWIDNGSKKKSEHRPRVSIKRAFDNGTLHPERRLHYSREIRSLIPYDLAVDWYSRHLYWTCELTNSINVTRLDYLEEYDYEEDGEEEDIRDEMTDDMVIGSILRGGEDKPRSIAIHQFKRYIIRAF